MMKVSIEQLKQRLHSTVNFHFCQQLAVGEEAGFIPAGPAEVSGVLTHISSDRYQAEAVFTVPVQQVCSRCGGEFVRDISGQASLVFQPGADAQGEEERWPVDGDELELDAALAGEVFFRLPMQPLCRPDCRGLCPTCGIDLNTHRCSCGGPALDPRWEKLKEFKLDDVERR